MKIKDIRQSHGMTQEAAAQFLKIPLRTYKRYESDEEQIPPIKKQYILAQLQSLGVVDENHGVLTVESIRQICAQVLAAFNVDFCYLFGSYAKGRATETSDVDLFLNTEINGLEFFGLVEALRNALNKRVDVLNQKQVLNNEQLLKEIMKEGIKIYG